MNRTVLYKAALPIVMVLICAPYKVNAYNIEDAIKAVQLNNNGIKASKENVNIAKTERAQAYTTLLPSINLSNANTRTTYDVPQVLPNSSSGDRRSTSLEVYQALFEGGASLFRIDAAKHHLKAVQSDHQSQVQEIVFKAMEAYERLVVIKTVYDFHVKNEEAMQQHLNGVEARFKVGEATVTEVAQARASFEIAKANKNVSSGEITALEASYESITGEKAPQNMDPVDISGVYIPSSLDELMQICLKDNASIVALSSSIESARGNTRVAYSGLAPKVIGAINVNATNIKRNSPYKQDGTTYMIKVNMPLFNQGGIEYVKIKEAKHRERKQKAALESQKSAIISAAVGIWTKYSSSHSTIASMAEAVKASEIALKGTIEESKVGTKTITDVLEAETKHLDTKIKHTQAIQEQLLAVFQMHQIMGTNLSMFTNTRPIVQTAFNKS
ncbi:TolC family protein [Rickettsiales endosymbiont of Peranema trichophorum]|uniref:TolC family protein n=1 Tax=Rickettsiales endosymbiont of Peranema trichophorum TaxID=2486577 RepID=UPI0013EE54A4|nr:TolC family protein [Rickettsiales endosymbiont of Peranema trichophorum]